MAFCSINISENKQKALKVKSSIVGAFHATLRWWKSKIEVVELLRSKMEQNGVKWSKME